jgi:hypothetical protein
MPENARFSRGFSGGVEKRRGVKLLFVSAGIVWSLYKHVQKVKVLGVFLGLRGFLREIVFGRGL